MKITDGLYILHPEGGDWIAAYVRHNRVIDITEACLLESHVKAGDRFANAAPADDDETITGPTADAIIQATMGNDTDVSMVTVTYRRST